MNTAKPISLFLVDDHTLVRAGLKLLLGSHANLSIAGEAGNAEDALDQLAAAPVDLLILDISMPKISGTDCLPMFRERFPEMKIIILSMHEDKSYVHRAMSLGAAGYVHKSSADIELFDAIDEIMAGNVYISRKIAQQLLNTIFDASVREDGVSTEQPLSAREREVLLHIVHGYSITETGELLHLSVKTVDTYKTRIMAKLKCAKKSDLVQFALKSGLLNAK